MNKKIGMYRILVVDAGGYGHLQDYVRTGRSTSNKPHGQAKDEIPCFKGLKD